MNDIQFKLFLIRVKIYLSRLFSFRKKLYVSVDDAFSIDLDTARDLPCVENLLGDYKQRGLYKDNPNFSIVKSNFIEDKVTGYIVYPDGTRSGEYTIPTAILETFFRKLPNPTQ